MSKYNYIPEESKPLEGEDLEIVLSLIDGSLELLQDPAHWAKGFYGYDARGEQVFANDEQAVCWCLLGAIVKAAKNRGGETRPHADGLVTFMWKYMKDDPRALVKDSNCNVRTLSCFNDHENTTHEDVLELFRKARKEIEEGAPVLLEKERYSRGNLSSHE